MKTVRAVLSAVLGWLLVVVGTLLCVVGLLCITGAERIGGQR